MSYQVLARKWRPQSFKEMVGQEHVLKALINSLDQQRLHHAYLFTGTRGVGKTTIGRILAKCLNCETGITSVPCGQCGACREIAEGRFVDLIEIDAASRTKVEDMRELLDNVQYSPTRGRFKVYLIDEVHMLSSSSFNALLKTLEEPPEHVKFLFATTDPQKLPVTILSRCLQFNLKNMPPERIVGHLKNVLGQEQIDFEDSALWLLARSADGSMRDALSLTDQAIAYGNHTLAERDVSAMLGSIDQKQVYRIIEAVANSNAASVLQEVSALAEFSPDYSAVLANVISVLHRVAVEQVVPGSTDNSMGDQVQIAELAKALTAEDVQLFYQVALVGRSDLPISPDQRAGLEMVLLRMLAFQPNIDCNIPKVKLSNHDSPVNSPSIQEKPESDVASTDSELANQGSDLTSTNEQASKPSVSDVQDASVNQGATEASANIESNTVEGATEEQAALEQAPLEQAQTVASEPAYSESSLVESAPSHVEEASLDNASQPPEGHPASDEFVGEGSYEDSTYEDSTYAGGDYDDNGLDDHYLQSQSSDGLTQKKTAELQVAPSQQASTSPEPEPGVSQQDTIAASVSAAIEELAPESNDINAFLPMDNPWPHILPLLKLTGMTQNLAANTSLILEQNRAELCAAEGNYKLLTDTHKSRIISAFKSLFGDNFNVDFSLGRTEVETPAEWKDRKKEERLALAISSIETDPNVVTLVNKFDATILTSTVEPLD
ncbi:DNA polymerase III subunit gamma/tau [Alkalimarinus alittae]|uniref:DNA polymerase III subunit gamma/tau n=1 Tax=Alkalimarinus alittae TaxID=2961619 RepID=A0ABY6N6R6_9ALTE|nr:DNA polymerase III subunit gamma/tau [Alkalimarinus alittae]UZE97791.1 DNA polymerase III subunit gamma/tau [Alkalimarinus alittae]